MKQASDSFPISPRMMSVHIGTRQVPEIEGSQGAFIAVVVTLSALIVVCCIAVFYLLRHHEPTEQERAVRRERSQYRRTRAQTQVQADTGSSGPTWGMGALGGKVKRLWQTKAGGSKRSGRARGERGWIRAGSDDEWASRSDHEGDPELGGARSLPVRDLKLDVTRAGGGGVRVASPRSDVESECVRVPYEVDAYAYGDPFSKVHGALKRSQSPLSSLTSSPRERASVDEDHEGSPGRDYRHYSTMSNGSVWTQAGSKFVEDI